MGDLVDIEKLLSTKEAARLPGVDLSPEHIGLLLRQGKVRGWLVGGVWLVDPDSLLAYVSQWHKPGPKPKEK